MAKRGMLTQTVIELTEKLFGYPFNQTELKLVPYFHYIMVNNQRIEWERVDYEEIEILSKWQELGFIVKGEPLSCTHKFWQAINEVLFIAYVDFENQPN